MSYRTRPRSNRFHATVAGLAFLLSLPAAASHAAGDGLIGKWEGPGEGTVSAHIRPDPARAGHFVAKIATAASRCFGQVEVGGRLGKSVTATATPEFAGDDLCTIRLRLTGANRLQVYEVKNCLTFHGAACGFTGKLIRR